jgi:regulator of protease activity HflC (stomatin/prohibitin superfamily)
VTDFRRRYQAQVNAYRASYGGSLSDAILQQMQVPQQVLQQMIEENAEIAEAEKMGIAVTDAEVRAQIVAIPGLQENGAFIGEQRYVALLRGINVGGNNMIKMTALNQGRDLFGQLLVGKSLCQCLSPVIPESGIVEE